jgi:hypothetical protein
MTYISKHPTRYVDLSAAFAEGKPKTKLDYAARKWLSPEAGKPVASKTLTGRQFDMIYAVADNRTDTLDMLCSVDSEEREGLVFSRYDELCRHLTGHSLLAYNDMDVNLMYLLMSLRSSTQNLAKVVPFMYDKNGKFKFPPPASGNPLLFVALHATVRASLRSLPDPARPERPERPERPQPAALRAKLLDRQNAGVWGPSNPGESSAHPYHVEAPVKSSKSTPGASSAHPYVIDY